MSFEFTQKMSGEVFRETKSYIILIFPVLFSLRLLYLNMTAANSREYGELIKGAVLFLALLLSYEYLLSLTFDFSRAIEGDIAQQTTQRLLLSQKDPISTPGLSLVRKTLGLITSVVYYLAQCLFIIALIFMSALAPIVFLFGTVLSMPSLIKIFFFLIIIGSSWPLLFSVFDRVGGSLLQNGLKSESQIFSWSIDLLIELFKLLGPLSFCKLLLHSTFGGSALSALSFGAKSSARIAGGFAHASAGFLPPLGGQFLKERYSSHRSPSRFGIAGSNGSRAFLGSRSSGSGSSGSISNGSQSHGIGTSKNGRHMAQSDRSTDSGKGPSSVTASPSSNNTSNERGRPAKSSPSKPMSKNREFNISQSGQGLAQGSESKNGISGAHSYLSNHSDLTGPFREKNSNSQTSSRVSQLNRGSRNQALTASTQQKREKMKERTRT
jgi:hypothetical protein